MQKIMPWLLLAGLVTVPLEANGAQYDNADVRTGAFVGARFKISLGGRAAPRPIATLSFAPTLSRSLANGEVRTSIGEGVALSLGTRPTITLMGIRADEALGFRSSRQVDGDRTLGLSKGGWVAVGVGAAVIGAAIVGFSVHDEARDNTD